MKDGGRRDLLGLLSMPAPRFLWGLALMPLVAFNADWTLLLVELAAAAVLLVLSGKRLRLMTNAAFLASVIAFSLLNPRGLVLAEWGPFSLTQKALFDGVRRGAAILCMVFVSGASVSGNLRLPGRFGSLLAEVFSAFNRLMEKRSRIDRRDWIGSVDAALFSVLDPDGEMDSRASDRAYAAERPSGPRLAAGIALFAATLAGASYALAISRGWL